MLHDKNTVNIFCTMLNNFAFYGGQVDVLSYTVGYDIL